MKVGLLGDRVEVTELQTRPCKRWMKPPRLKEGSVVTWLRPNKLKVGLLGNKVEATGLPPGPWVTWLRPQRLKVGLLDDMI